jgi:putative peptidoglycan lipid II flippase
MSPSKPRRLAQSGAVILAVTSLLSYLLGLVRDRLLAREFGAGLEVDLYNSAFIVPEFMLNLWITGALVLALIPVLSTALSRGERAAAFRSFNAILSLLALVMLVLEVIAFATMPVLASLVAPGFSAAEHAEIAKFSRLLLVASIFFTLSGVWGAVLVSTRRFLGFALSPVAYNLGIIGGIVLLAPRFGITGVVYGAVAGSILHLSVRLWGLRAEGYRPQWVWDLKNKGLREILRLTGPRMAGLLVYEGNLWLFNALASFLAVGSIAIFNFARNFQSLPVSLFGISLATAAFPVLAAHFARQEEAAFTAAWARALARIFFFTIPAAVGMMLLAQPIVATFLEGGRFTAEDTRLTALALGAFAWAIVFESAVHLLARTFYARHDTVTPMKVILVATVVNALVSISLSRVIGVVALPLGFSAMTLTQMLALLWLLRGRLPSLRPEILLPALGKTILAAVAMVGVVAIVRWQVGNTVLELGLGLLLGAGGFFTAAYLLRMPELVAVQDIMRSALKLDRHRSAGAKSDAPKG